MTILDNKLLDLMLCEQGINPNYNGLDEAMISEIRTESYEIMLEELLYENDECIDLEEEIIDIGFPEGALEEVMQAEHLEPATVHISEYKGFYIVWIDLCSVDGVSYESGEENEACAVYDNLEEARIYRDSLLNGEVIIPNIKTY